MSEERGNAITRAKTILSRARNYSSDPEIQSRLEGILSNTARAVGYKVANDPAYRDVESSLVKQELERQIISEMVNQRALEKARDKSEALRAAEKMSQDLVNELRSFKGSLDDANIFLGSLCMIYETGRKGLKAV